MVAVHICVSMNEMHAAGMGRSEVGSLSTVSKCQGDKTGQHRETNYLWDN